MIETNDLMTANNPTRLEAPVLDITEVSTFKFGKARYVELGCAYGTVTAHVNPALGSYEGRRLLAEIATHIQWSSKLCW